MRVLLSTIGSRGDVQPMVALAMQLRELGQEARICAPPDFRDWIEGLGIPFTPVGPEVSQTAKASPPVTPEQRRQMLEDMVANQFEAIAEAAGDCDIVLGFAALNIATRSVAEQRGIPYVYASFCPVTLPSPHHAPPPVRGFTPPDETGDNRTRWANDAERWTASFGPALNSRRSAVGLAPVTDVRAHIFTDTPWLAADPTLAPWPEPADLDVFQTGAWILPDQRPLSPELEAFLEAGEPPVYFGFGSMRDPGDVSRTMIETARALGRRAIVSRGWADLALIDDEPDCLSIGETNLQALFRRVAAVVHHGGSGTTTITTQAGAPQVIVPQFYDQHYFAQRIQDLGVGAAHASSAPTVDSLTAALSQALQPDVVVRAKSVADEVRTDGALVATRRLMTKVI